SDDIIRTPGKETEPPLSPSEGDAMALRVGQTVAARESGQFSDSVNWLRRITAEITAFGEHLPVNAQGFFQDPGAFRTLKSEVFPKLRANRAATVPIRIWVPGCSTGEEVYSLAIALAEFMAGRGIGNTARIFGTDTSEAALAGARIGLYGDDLKGKI